MENKFIITHDWLRDKGAYNNDIEAFDKHFPDGENNAIKVLKMCADWGHTTLGIWLVGKLPFCETSLEIQNTKDNLFYPGNVYIKNDVNLDNRIIFIKGELKIDGKLIISGKGNIYAKCVYANEIYMNGILDIRANMVNAERINISAMAGITAECINTNEIKLNNSASIRSNIKASNLSISDSAIIAGDIKAESINLTGGEIYGDVVSDNLTNNRGRITGDVKANEITIINGGTISRKINTLHFP